MSYTIKNLRALEDLAPKFGLAPDVEARFGREALGCESLGFSLQRFAPNVRTFGHRHKEQEEVYVVTGGGGRVKIDDEVHPLGEWDVLRVAPGVTRAFEAGPDGLELLAFGAPQTPPGDAEIFPDWWQ